MTSVATVVSLATVIIVAAGARRRGRRAGARPGASALSLALAALLGTLALEALALLFLGLALLALAAVLAFAGANLAHLEMLRLDAGVVLCGHGHLGVGSVNRGQLLDTLSVSGQLKHQLAVVVDSDAASAANAIPAQVQLDAVALHDAGVDAALALDAGLAAIRRPGLATAAADRRDGNADGALLDVRNAHRLLAAGHGDDLVVVVGSALATRRARIARRRAGRAAARARRARRRRLGALIAAAATAVIASLNPVGSIDTPPLAFVTVSTRARTAATVAARTRARAVASSRARAAAGARARIGDRAATALTFAVLIALLEEFDVDAIVVHGRGGVLPFDIGTEILLAAAADITGRMRPITACAAALILAASLRMRIAGCDSGIAGSAQQSSPTLAATAAVVTGSCDDDQHQENDHDNGDHCQNFSHFRF